jgi:hypothetical protein
MATSTNAPRSHLAEHTTAGEHDASRHIPIGRYTDDPAANAHHSADIADMRSTHCAWRKSPPTKPSWPPADHLTRSAPSASRPKKS